MDRFKLFDLFVNGTSVKLCGYYGTITSIEREDGSGYRFNVRLRLDGEVNAFTTVFVDTSKGF